MERHQLHGTINPDFARPDPKLVRRFAAHDTAKVADAMAGYGVAHPEIKPLRPEMRLCGPALTVLTQPDQREQLLRLESLSVRVEWLDGEHGWHPPIDGGVGV